MNIEETLMNIIMYAGQAKSLAMKSIESSRNKRFSEGDNYLLECETHLKNAHIAHHQLLTYFSDETKSTSISLFLIHAEDHLMAATTSLDFAKEFKLLYHIIYDQN